MNPYRTQDNTTSSSHNHSHQHTTQTHPQHLPHHLTRLDNDSATQTQTHPSAALTNGTNESTTSTNPTTFTEKQQQEMAPPASRQQMHQHHVYEHPSYTHGHQMNPHAVYQNQHPLAQTTSQHQHGNMPASAMYAGYNHSMSLPSSPPPAYMAQEHQHAVPQHYGLPSYDEHSYTPQWQPQMRAVQQQHPAYHTSSPVSAATAAATGQSVLASSPPSYRHSNGMVHQHNSSNDQSYWNSHLPPHLQSQPPLSSPQQLVPSQYAPLPSTISMPLPSMTGENVERGFPFYTNDFDQTGETPPAGFDMNELKNVKASLWEDLGTVAYSKEVNESCVARRESDDYVNGTKLLNVTKMTRGRRDGLLKNEKDRIVVRIGPMHLKGVWIPLDRALNLANREQITPALYPLFCKNLKDILEPVMRAEQGLDSASGPGPDSGSPSSAVSQSSQTQNQTQTHAPAQQHGHVHQSSSGSSANGLPSMAHSVVGTPIRTPPRGPHRSPPSAGTNSIVHSSGGTYYGQHLANGHAHHNGYASHAQHAQVHGYHVLGPAPGSGIAKKGGKPRRQSAQVHLNGNGHANGEHQNQQNGHYKQYEQ